MAELRLNTAESTRLQITEDQQKSIQKLYKDAAKEVSKKANKAPRVPSDALQKMYLNSLRKQLDKQIENIGAELQGMVESNMRATSDAVVDANREFLREIGMPIEGSFSHVSDSVVRSIVTGQLYEGEWSLSHSIWSGTKKTQQDIRSIIAQGVAQNKSSYDIAKDLEKYVDPAAQKEWDWSKVYPGTAKKVDYNAQRLARTMVSHAYQQSFVRTTQKNPFVTEYQWLSSGGERMCELCEERDGQMYPKDDLPLDHPNGMCTFKAVIPDDMTAIADRLADWAEGKPDPELDEYSKFIYNGSFWRTELKTPGSAVQEAKQAVDHLGSLSWDRGIPIRGNEPSDENKAFTPLNFDADILKELKRLGSSASFDRSNPEIVEVSLSTLKTPQGFVYKDKVKSYIDKIASGDDIKSADKSGVVSGIQVFEHNGQLYLYEGNHRASAYKLLGVDKITVEKIRMKR